MSTHNLIETFGKFAEAQTRVAMTLLWSHFWSMIVYVVAVDQHSDLADPLLSFNLTLVGIEAINYLLMCVGNCLVNILINANLKSK